MELTRERALELHRRMWTDMQQELGDNPCGIDRVLYKNEWCDKYFPKERIANDYFLCEYIYEGYVRNCKNCPIKWATENNNDAITTFCCYDNYYFNAPISEILALPERKISEDN